MRVGWRKAKHHRYSAADGVMRRLLTTCALSAFTVTTTLGQPSLAAQSAPVPAAAGDSAPTGASPDEPFEIVRLGDGAMSCETLIGEIRTYNNELQAMQQQMSAAAVEMSESALNSVPGGGMGGMAMGLGGVAASFVPGAAVAMGAVQAASALAGQAAMRNRRRKMSEQMGEMVDNTSRMGPLSQRVEHLSEIARSRSC